jgi:hypothetical protein
MAENRPSIEEWRQLYEAFIRVKEMAPWEWMEETDVFGVQDPETGKQGFVSVMGMLGEHHAVAFYLGAKGLYGFWDFHDVGHFEMPEKYFEIPQLQASYEDRDELKDKDRAIIKQLGLKFRGRQAWPLFRSYRPGFYPWYLEAGEAHLLTHVLEQTLDVAPRFKEDPSLLDPFDDDRYLVRAPSQNGGTLTWEDRIVRVPPPEPAKIPIAIDVQTLEKLKRLPRSQHTIEIDFFMMRSVIHEKGARPYFPYMLLVVEASRGVILGTELLSPEISLEAMWGSIGAHVLKSLAGVRIVPQQISVRSELLLGLLQPLANELGFQLRQSPFLPGLDPAKEALLERF